jgi:hypothetical protein
MPKRKRLKSTKKKRKTRQKKVRMSDVAIGLGGGLAVAGGVTGALGYKGGGDLMAGGLGLAGAGVGLSLLEGLGEGFQKMGKRSSKYEDW